MHKLLNSKWIKAVAILFALTLLLEAVVFNFRYFTSLMFEDSNILVSDYKLGSGIEESASNSFKIISSYDKTIEISNLDAGIKNIYLDIANKSSKINKQAVNVTLLPPESENLFFINPSAKDIVRKIEKSKYLYLSGDSKSLKIQINEGVGEEFVIDGIVVNKHPPMFFSFGRCIAVFAFLLFIYIARPKSELYKYVFDDKNRTQHHITVLVCSVFCLFFCFQALHNNYAQNPPFSFHYQYNKLTDALLDGQVYLHDEPPEYLKEMENPYDTTAREELAQENGEYFAWDSAYFQGKYYVYFGITPVLMFYLPYKGLTGSDFKNVWAVQIYCCMAVFAIFGILSQIIRKRFSKTPYLLYLLLCATFVAASGIFTLTSRPFLYEVSCAASLALTLLGIYLWLSSIKTGQSPASLADGKDIVLWRVILGSLCMALVAGCRPQLLIGALFGIPIFWNAIIKKRNLFSKQNLCFAAAFCLPFILVGAGIMYYNYVRFGSIFDFGANYNLTTNDMTARGFSLARIPSAIWMYLFQPANISGEFPFIRPTEFYTGFVINTIREDTYGGAFNNIILLANLLVVKYRAKLKEKGLLCATIICMVSAVVLAVFCAQVAGILHRYFTDIVWLLLFSSCIIILVMCESLNKSRHKYVYAFVLTGFFISLAFNIFSTMDLWKDFWQAIEPGLYYRIQSAIQFWL